MLLARPTPIKFFCLTHMYAYITTYKKKRSFPFHPSAYNFSLLSCYRFVIALGLDNVEKKVKLFLEGGARKLYII